MAWTVLVQLVDLTIIKHVQSVIHVFKLNPGPLLVHLYIFAYCHSDTYCLYDHIIMITNSPLNLQQP